jgi:hypothetical protein
MIRKSILFLIFIFALNIFAFAQTGMLGGKIELDEGGKKTPYANAVVEAFRTDVKGKLPTAKSNGKGIFTFVGVQYNGIYVISVSGPDIEPTIYPDLKADKTDIVITVVKGSGKRLTEDEVKARLNSMPQANGNGELTAEQKKQMAEEQKKYDEAKVKHDKEVQSQDVIIKAYNEAYKALTEKNYDLAVAKSDEGVAAVSDFPGTTSPLLNVKAQALNKLGVIAFNKVKETPDKKVELYETAKKYWSDSIIATKQGIEIINKAIGLPASNSSDSIAPINASSGGFNEQEKKNFANTRLNLYISMLDAYSLLIVNEIDQSRSSEASPLFNEYFVIATESKNKSWGHKTFGDVLRMSYDYAGAVVEYKKFLELTPDDLDGLAYLGLCLYTDGLTKKASDSKAIIEEGKLEMQEGLNVLTRFIDLAPADYSKPALKQSIKETIEYLKTTEKLAPQKTTPQKPKKP